MAWEPPEGISLADAFYEVMTKITHRDWLKFARSALRLEQCEIDEIKEDFRGNAKEQKYKMLESWSKRIGSNVSVEYLYTVLNHYLFPSSCPSPVPPKKCEALSQSRKETHTGGASNKVEVRTLDPVQLNPTSDLESQLDQYCSKVVDLNVVPCSPEFFGRNSVMSSNYQCANRKGTVCIINNSFTHCPVSYRKGSEVDLKNMENLWKKLGCEVEVHTDLDCNDLNRILGNFANSCDSCDYCVVVIMSHGNCVSGSDVILANNGEKIFVKNVLELFNNVKSPHLQGIPKLFFFQCCRGASEDSGVYASGDEPPVPVNETESRPTPNLQGSRLVLPRTEREEPMTVADTGPTSVKLPTVSDMLISYATQFGHQAYRNTEYGSWFINAIANVFSRHAKDEHVLDLMVKVNEAVSAKSANQDGAKSMPHIEFTLVKKLYLYPLAS